MKQESVHASVAVREEAVSFLLFSEILSTGQIPVTEQRNSIG